MLRDLGSTNGTLVNGNSVTETEIKSGDIVEFGEIKMEFQSGQIQ